MGQKFWGILFKLIPQVMAAEAAIEAKGGHGSYEVDLSVKDKATGEDVIAAVDVADVTF